jgi:hypothetical protein
MTQVTTILSMLHEPSGAHSATRRFRGEPVLNWTLRRLGREATVLCWDDQAAAAAECGANLSVRGPRQWLEDIETVAAARRWADGWRGGLMGTCEFDRGFHGPWIDEIRRQNNADGVLLVDPSAGLVDSVLIDALLQHGRQHDDLDFCFSQAAPGLSGVMIAAPLLERLASAKSHPGTVLTYRPDLPRRDPIGERACVAIPVPLARTTRRFTLDSQRQIARMSAATAHLNGQLITTDALGLLAAVEAADVVEPLPREMVIELTTARTAQPIFSPRPIQRPPMDLETFGRLVSELAEMDDVRLVLAGIGDPLLHDQLPSMIKAASAAGIRAIALESDLIGVPADRVAALAEAAVDIVSVHLPAATAKTYHAVMGIDAFAQAMANIALLADKRKVRGVPLLVPTFVKCKANQAEMESWYDHWLRVLGCAVVSGPSDFGGLIEDVSAVDMSPPRRLPCISLSKRLAVLSDGAIVSCDQDVTGRQQLGRYVKEAWQKAQDMRRDHIQGLWTKYPKCAACKQWHRH